MTKVGRQTILYFIILFSMIKFKDYKEHKLYADGTKLEVLDKSNITYLDNHYNDFETYASNLIKASLAHDKEKFKLKQIKYPDYNILRVAYERNYDYVSMFSFITKGGQRYRYVSIKNDDEYEYGWLNEKTLKEDVPCNYYKIITNLVKNGMVVFSPVYYANDIEGNLDKIYFDELGIHIDNVATNRNYDYISDDEFLLDNGTKYRKVSIYNDQGYIHGWLNLTTYSEDIPCKTYKELDSVSDKDYYIGIDEHNKIGRAHV